MKRIIKIFAVGVCLGVLLSFIRIKLQIDTNVFMRYYWVFGVAVVMGAVLFNVIYNMGYQKKMEKAAVLLEDGRAFEYIEAMEKLLQTAKGSTLKNVLKLNLSAGYCALKQYGRAESILNELSNERLRGMVKMAHRLNLCICYFYTSQSAKAVKLYDESQREFERFRKGPIYRENLAVLDTLVAIEKGQYSHAEKLIKNAKENCSKPRLQEDYKYIEELLAKRREQ